MFKYSAIFATCVFLSSACGLASEGDEVDQIVDNLVEAGYPEEDIQIYGEQVYVGNDSHVTLEASEEMIDGDSVVDLDTIQYRTRNLISRKIKTICLVDTLPAGNLKEGLTRAIKNYNSLGLTFKLKRGVVGCQAKITVQIAGGSGGSAGFPSRGKPYDRVKIGLGVADYGLGVSTHVITHELGHTLGFRHSDFYNRSISCGTGGNEGEAGVGSIHIPGTPTQSVLNGSVMNSCYNSGSTGKFTKSDKHALRLLY